MSAQLGAAIGLAGFAFGLLLYFIGRWQMSRFSTRPEFAPAIRDFPNPKDTLEIEAVSDLLAAQEKVGMRTPHPEERHLLIAYWRARELRRIGRNVAIAFGMVFLALVVAPILTTPL